MLVGLVRDTGELVEKGVVLNEAALFGNFDGYPLPVVNSMLGSNYRPATPSASQIAGGAHRRTVLERLINYYAHPRSLYALTRGTLVHSGLESFTPGVEVVKERRLNYIIPGTDIRMSGQIDVYYPQHQRLEDYKTAQKIPDIIKDEHVFQLAVYYWLLLHNKMPVLKAVIDYVAWDSMAQISQAEMPDGSIEDIMNHPFFKDEDVFNEAVISVYDLLNDGFTYNRVPSTKDCNLSYCRYCTVKWACDQIDVHGNFIETEDFVQHEGDVR